MRVFLHAILCIALLCSFMGIQMVINFMGWYPQHYDAIAVVASAVLVSSSSLLFVLGYKVKNSWAMTLMTVLSIAVLILGWGEVFSERLNPDSFLGRKTYSPVYYKTALAFFFSLPLAGILTGFFFRRYSLVISSKNQTDG